METTIKLSNGKIFNLLEDNFTSQDYHELPEYITLTVLGHYPKNIYFNKLLK